MERPQVPRKGETLSNAANINTDEIHGEYDEHKEETTHNVRPIGTKLASTARVKQI